MPTVKFGSNNELDLRLSVLPKVPLLLGIVPGIEALRGLARQPSRSQLFAALNPTTAHVLIQSRSNCLRTCLAGYQLPGSNLALT